jgi:hypothetical protein
MKETGYGDTGYKDLRVGCGGMGIIGALGGHARGETSGRQSWGGYLVPGRTSNNRTFTEHFDPSGTSTRHLVRSDTSYPWQWDTRPQHPGILRLPLSQDGHHVTCDILCTLFYLDCDLLSICNIFSVCFLLPLSHTATFCPYVFYVYVFPFCDILSHCNTLFLV